MAPFMLSVLATLATLAMAQESDGPTTEILPPEGTGQFSLPVEPPAASDDTSLIQITIITDSSPPILPTGDVPVSLPTPIGEPSFTDSIPTPTPPVSGAPPSQTPSDSSSKPPLDDEPSSTPSTTDPDSAAAATGVFHHAAGAALVAAVGLGLAI